MRKFIDDISGLVFDYEIADGKLSVLTPIETSAELWVVSEIVATLDLNDLKLEFNKNERPSSD